MGKTYFNGRVEVEQNGNNYAVRYSDGYVEEARPTSDGGIMVTMVLTKSKRFGVANEKKILVFSNAESIDFPN